jgi:hypothetical protein
MSQSYVSASCNSAILVQPVILITVYQIGRRLVYGMPG